MKLSRSHMAVAVSPAIAAVTIVLLLQSTAVQQGVSFVQVASAISTITTGCDKNIGFPYLSTFTWNFGAPSSNPSDHLTLREFHVKGFTVNSTTLILTDISVLLHNVHDNAEYNYTYFDYWKNQTVTNYTPAYSSWFDVNASVSYALYQRSPGLVTITIDGVDAQVAFSGATYNTRGQTHYFSGESTHTTFTWKCSDAFPTVNA